MHDRHLCAETHFRVDEGLDRLGNANAAVAGGVAGDVTDVHADAAVDPHPIRHVGTHEA